MNKIFFISTFLIIGVSTQCLSQSLNVRSIFNSGATGGVEFLTPSFINDSTNFQLTKYKVQFVKVLRTKEVDIKDFDLDDKKAKANQLFLSSKFSMAKSNLSNDNYFQNIYNAELELIYITASKRRGVWLHSANVSATESKNSFKNDFTPNFRAYSVYAHVNPKNLDFIPFIGPGVAINQGKLYALPVVGFWAKLNSRFSAEIIVPIHVKLKYNFADKVEFELATSYSKIHAVYREGSVYNDNDNTINLRQLKNHLGINTRISKYYKIKVELGYAFFQELNALSTNFSQKMSSMPYFNVSFNYNFGNSVLYKFFNQEERSKSKEE